MSDLTPSPSGDLSVLEISVRRLTDKLSTVAEAVKKLTAERTQLENKIEDAQKRIQHILSRLPEQSDGRQLNLLGEAVPPNNPEDDNEPTTH
jgi:predicted  nucleic acid-binding Zn-ribbon protein